MDRIQRQRELGAMSTFERAKAKHERKRELASMVKPVAPIPVVVAPVESKEKPQSDAVIEVLVRLPDREISLVLTKPNVYSNVPKSKVTEAELRKAISNGLAALMGAVK
jgi:hypothetical protein